MSRRRSQYCGAQFSRAATVAAARGYLLCGEGKPGACDLERLNGLGFCFDAASIYEIDLCLELGVDPARISFGNTIKKEAHIAAAYEKGVSLFTVDSEAELVKTSRVAPVRKFTVPQSWRR